MFLRPVFGWLLLLPVLLGGTVVAAGEVAATAGGEARIDEVGTQRLAPETVAGVTTIDTGRAKALFDKGVVFIDVRKNADWEAGRVPGAVHLELDSAFNERNLVHEIGKDEEVVIYCNGQSCLRSSTACARAVAWGYSRIYYLRDGFPGWQSAGLPIE